MQALGECLQVAEPYQTARAAAQLGAQAVSSFEAPPPEVQKLQPNYLSFTSAAAGTNVDTQVSAVLQLLGAQAGGLHLT